MTGNNDAVNESLSALVDAEHTELDLRRVLKAAENDDEVLAKWASYHVTRSVITKEVDQLCDTGFLDAVRSGIAGEALVFHHPQHGRLRRYAGKTAVAACVMFAVLIGVGNYGPSGISTEQVNEVVAHDKKHEPVAVVPSGFDLPPLTARAVSSVPGTDYVPTISALSARAQKTAPTRQELLLSPEAQAQLNRLMMRHAESSAANGGLGVIPFTRVSVVQDD